jgi:predicted dehydrogenase
LRGANDYVGTYAAEWAHFVEAAAGRVPADASLEDGIRNVGVLLAARESLETGRAVQPAATAERVDA